jgi:uncharacterized membrane protein YdjX (TVP38/TMEM64 family)
MVPDLGRVRARLADVQVFRSARSRRRFLVHLLAAAVALVGATIAFRRHLTFLTDAAALRAFIRQYGVWSPVVLVALQALQVVVAPVPGQLLAVVGGYLFGTWLGTLYNMIGILVGSTVAFWLARRFGRAYVESIVHEEALAKFDGMNDDYARLTLFLAFLLPGLPDDVICFAGGLTRIPLWQLVAIALVGRAPGFFLANVVGDLLGTRQLPAAIGLSIALLVLSALGYLNRDRLVSFVRERTS